MLLRWRRVPCCVAMHNAPPALAEVGARDPMLPTPALVPGRVVATKQVVHIADHEPQATQS